MAFAKIILSTVFVSFMLSTFVLTQDIDVVPEIINNNEKYRGTWYIIGIIWIEPVMLDSCIKHDVILGVGDSISINISSIDYNKNAYQGQLIGEIVNSEWIIGQLNNYHSYHIKMEYDDGNELVLCRSPEFNFCSILSRQSTVPEKLLDIYREWAKEKNIQITYVNQRKCT